MEEKTEWEKLVENLCNALSEFWGNVLKGIQELEESGEGKAYALMEKIKDKYTADKNGQTLEKIALHAEEENIYVSISVLRSKETGEIEEIYPVLKNQEDYEVNKELDLKAGFTVHEAEIETCCKECGMHNTEEG